MRSRSSNRCLVIAGVLVALCGTRVRAQDAPVQPVTFGVMAGGENVTGAILHATRGLIRPGIALGALAQFPLAPRRLALRADVLFHWVRDDVCYGFRDCGVTSEFSYVWSGSLSMVARLNDPATRWSPYVLAGAAAYSYDFADGNIKALRPNHLGLQGGIGFEARPWKTTVFAEVRYMGIPPGGVLPFTIGMRF